MDDLRISDSVARSLGAAGGSPEAPAKVEGSGAGFVEKLGEALRTADADQKSLETQASSIAAGEGDIVETMIQFSRADMSLRFVVELRNRALAAYQEVMRLPL